MDYILLAGRILFSFVFILSAFGHFKKATIDFAAARGVPFATLLVPFSGILELAGGLSVLIGYETRWGAWLLVVFLVPVTVAFHAFWKVKDPVQRQLEMVMFMKNMAMLGAALILAYFGSGALSVTP